jgi:hypothetical protein
VTISIPHAEAVSTKPIHLTAVKRSGWFSIFVVSTILWIMVLTAGIVLLSDRLSNDEIRIHKLETYIQNNERVWDNHYKKTHKIYVKKDEWEK